MGNQLTVPSGSSWYQDDFNSYHLKNPKSIFDGTFNLSFRAEEKQEIVAVKAIQLSGKDGRSIAQTFYNIYDDKSKAISRTKSGNLISTPILTKNAAYLKRPYIDMPITERIVIDPPLELFEKKWIAFQLLHSIRNLHKITIFHGDIKPENVLVDPNLTIYLVDHAPFKPQYISQNQPHYFIHFFSYGRPSAFIAPERISMDLSTNPELQKEQTNRAILAIQAITESLEPTNLNQTNSNDNLSGQIKSDDTELKATENDTDTNEEVSEKNPLAMEALHFMQAADLFSIGCVLAFIFTGKSLFDFTSLIQYGHSKDDSPLKILEQIDDDMIRSLILKLIDRDQMKRVEAISHFEDSFPSWMNDLYHFYIDKIIDVPVSKLNSMSCLDKVSQIFPFETHDDILIYLNIVSEFFSQKLKISQLSFFIRHFEQLSLRLSSPKLKIVRLIPPLLFLLQRESSTISLLALDSVINIVRSIESIENEEDEIVKNFCDIFFIPQLIAVMDPKKKTNDNNKKIVIISRIPVILAEFSRLWPSILEKLPMRTEFIIPMLQYGGNSPIDETKLMIVRYFLASARNITFTKSYPVFRALYRMLFQVINCSVYVPLIVEFVKEFLDELNHVDKIRFYSELFAPFQGAVLSYASNYTKSNNVDDILVIFDTFTSMLERGEIKTASFTAIANAAYKHVTSFETSSRVAARVLLKKLPLIYQEFDIIPIVSPQTLQTTQNSPQPPLPLQKSQRVTMNTKPQQQQALSKSTKSSRNTISLSGNQKKKYKKGNSSVPLIDDTNVGSSIETISSSNELNESVESASSNQNLSNLVQTNSTPTNGSNENLSILGNSSTISNSSNVNTSQSAQTIPPENELVNNNSNTSLSAMSSSQRTIQETTNIKSTPTKYYQPQQSQIKTQLYSSTKISSSSIQKILIVQEKSEDSVESIVLHSKNTVVSYNVKINNSTNFKYNSSSSDHKIIEQSSINVFPKPVTNIDLYKVNNESGLIISFPDSIYKRTKGSYAKILETKKPFKLSKMVNGATIAFSDANYVVCRDIFHNFELKGSYHIDTDNRVNGIYSWESMDDNFFAVTTSNGRLHAIDQRTNVPIFTTCEYKDMSHVVLLPHLAYSIVQRSNDLNLYRYSPVFETEEMQVKNDSGGYSPKPIYELKGNVDSMMSISNSLLILNQYGTFMLDNLGDCYSLSDKNRCVHLNPKNNLQNHFFNRMYTSAALPNVLATPTHSNDLTASSTRHRSTSIYDVNKMSLAAANIAKSEMNLRPPKNAQQMKDTGSVTTPVVNLPLVNKSTLHGHTFPVTTCANFNNGTICISGDCAGYLNIWSATHSKFEFV